MLMVQVHQLLQMLHVYQELMVHLFFYNGLHLNYFINQWMNILYMFLILLILLRISTFHYQKTVSIQMYVNYGLSNSIVT